MTAPVVGSKLLKNRYELVAGLDVDSSGSRVWTAFSSGDRYLVKTWPYEGETPDRVQRALWDQELRMLYKLASSPRADKSGRTFWAGTLLLQERRCPTHDQQLGLELMDPPSSGAQLDGLAARDAGNLAAIDPVLLDPFRQRHRMDTEVHRGLLLLFSSSDQRDGTRSELGGVRMGHSAQPLGEAAT